MGEQSWMGDHALVLPTREQAINCVAFFWLQEPPRTCQIHAATYKNPDIGEDNSV